MPLDAVVVLLLCLSLYIPTQRLSRSRQLDKVSARGGLAILETHFAIGMPSLPQPSLLRACRAFKNPVLGPLSGRFFLAVVLDMATASVAVAVAVAVVAAFVIARPILFCLFAECKGVAP